MDWRLRQDARTADDSRLRAFSRSLYYNDKGRERGIAVELVRDWERYLNIKYSEQLEKRPLTIYIAPATGQTAAVGRRGSR